MFAQQKPSAEEEDGKDHRDREDEGFLVHGVHRRMVKGRLIINFCQDSAPEF